MLILNSHLAKDAEGNFGWLAEQLGINREEMVRGCYLLHFGIHQKAKD
jgi:hypothetical protein